MIHRVRFFAPVRIAASALLLMTATLAPGMAAHAQVVYSSLAGTFTNTAAVTSFAYVDDYTSTLFNPAAPVENPPTVPVATFRLSSLSFVGGPTFTGASTAANSTIRFSFLDQFGGLVSTFTQTFSTSGSFLRTVDVSALNITAAAKGFFQVTTSATTAASFEFTNTSPTVGSNSPNVGNSPAGVKAFSLTAAAAPEPTSAALLALGTLGMTGLGAIRARRRSA